MTVVISFTGRVNTHPCAALHAGAICTCDHDRDGLRNSTVIERGHSGDGDLLGSIEAPRCSIFTRKELEG